jgi:hypothetical protein
MKKYFVFALVLLATTAAFAQKRRSVNPTPTTQAKDTTSALQKALQSAKPAPPPVNPNKKDWSKVKLDTRKAADHFMIEVGYDNWANTPDSIHIQGFNRSFSFYFMYNFPFKSDVRWSVAAGLGIGSSNIYFHDQEVLVSAYNNQTLAFPDETGTYHFKKYKLVITDLQVPLELRFAVDPTDMDHSWKIAVGAKVGLMLSAYTKGKDLVSGSGVTAGNYTEKESSKQFFSTPQFVPTLRVSKGVVGVFAQLQVNSPIKTSDGPSVFPFSAGIVLSGL